MRFPDVPSHLVIQEVLTHIWQQVLEVEFVAVGDNFFEIGGDSLLGMQMLSRARQASIELSYDQLLEYQTIENLAAVAGKARAVQAEQGSVSGPMPLTPRQVQFFAENPRPYSRGTPVLFTAQQRMDPDLFLRTIRHVVAHHDGLRIRFTLENGARRAHVAAQEEHDVFWHIDLISTPNGDQEQAVRAAQVSLQDSLDLSNGPLMRVALIDRGPDRSQLVLFVIHHLLFDNFSIPILVEDMETTYDQLSHARPVQLPAKTTSVKAWANRLMEYARSAEASQQLEYWTSVLCSLSVPLPIDHPQGIGTKGRMGKIKKFLSSEETDILVHLVPRVFGAGINELLLTALLRGFASWTGSRSLLVDLRGHGRDPVFGDMDVTRTVGWFTTHYPVLLTLGSSDQGRRSVSSIRQKLNEVPDGGISYGVLRYLHPDNEVRGQLQRLAEPQVSFNYKGRFGPLYSGLSRLVGAGTGRVEAKHDVRATSGIRISSEIAWDLTELRFVYHENVYARGTMEHLVDGTMDALRDLLAECEAVAGRSRASSATG